MELDASFWATVALVLFFALIIYLKENRLIDRREAAEDWLKIGYDLKDGFHLELEDYLGGLILLSNELVLYIWNYYLEFGIMLPVSYL